jgi:hypothetical protein
MTRDFKCEKAPVTRQRNGGQYSRQPNEKGLAPVYPISTWDPVNFYRGTGPWGRAMSAFKALQYAYFLFDLELYHYRLGGSGHPVGGPVLSRESLLARMPDEAPRMIQLLAMRGIWD